MTDIANLRVKVDSSDVRGAKKDLDKLKGSGVGATSAIGSLTKSFGALATVGVVGSAFSSIVSTAVDFESAMAQVSAITGATGGDLEKLQETARELGATTSFSASQAADAMKFLGQAGFDTEQIIATIPGVLDLAKAAALDLGTAADITSNIMSGFGIEASESGRVVDVLAKVAASANTDVQQLGEAMKLAAPVASKMGVSIEETAAIIGKLSDQGLQSTVAGTGVRTMLLSLVSPSNNAKKSIESLGLSLEDVNPQAVGLTQAMETLQGAGLDAATATEIFGREGSSAALAIAGTTDGVNDLTTALENADGAASDMAATMSDTAKGSIDEFNSAVESLKLTLAGDNSIFRGLVEGATWSAGKLDKLVKEFQDGTTWYAQITAEMVIQYKEMGLLDSAYNILLPHLNMHNTALARNAVALQRSNDHFHENSEKAYEAVKGVLNYIDTLVPAEQKTRAYSLTVDDGTRAFYEYGTGASDAAGETAIFSDAIAKEIKSMKRVEAAVMSGTDALEAQTREKLRAQGAGEKQIETYIRTKNAIDAEVQARRDAESEARRAAARKEQLKKQLADELNAVKLLHAEIVEGIDVRKEQLTLSLRQKGATEDEIRAHMKLKDAIDKETEARVRREQSARDFDALKESLRSEEQVIADSYNRRRQLVMQNATSDAERNALLSAIEAERNAQEQAIVDRQQADRDAAAQAAQQRQDDAARLAEERLTERDRLMEALMTEEDLIRQSYERRREDILQAEALTGEERTALLEKAQEDYAAKLLAYQQAQSDLQLSAAGQMFDSLLMLTESWGDNQSEVYKGLFAVSKAFAIAESLINIQRGIAAAFGSGVTPFDRAVYVAQAIAEGATIVSNLRSIEASGLFDNGGNIYSGQTGIVGEVGPEIVRGPAIVTSRRETQGIMGGSGDGVKVTIQNYGTTKAFDVEQISAGEVRVIARDEARAVVRQDAPSVVASDIDNPNGRVSKSINRNNQTARRRQ